MTDWLLGTLLATSGLIVLVLLLREPVRRHFGARVAYGLWMIPAARLLMPTITQTIERPVSVDFSPRMMTSQAVAEPMLMSGVAAPEQTIIEQAGGWPTLLLVVWLGVAIGLFAARIRDFRRERHPRLCGALFDRRVQEGPRSLLRRRYRTVGRGERRLTARAFSSGFSRTRTG